jgi:hypothetical protein
MCFAIRPVAGFRGAISGSAGFVVDVSRGRLLQEATDLRVGFDQALHAAAQVRVTPASFVEVGSALGRAGFFQGGEKNRFCRQWSGHARFLKIFRRQQCEETVRGPSPRSGF